MRSAETEARCKPWETKKNKKNKKKIEKLKMVSVCKEVRNLHEVIRQCIKTNKKNMDDTSCLLNTCK